MAIIESGRLIIREYDYKDIPFIQQFSEEAAKREELPDEVFDIVNLLIAEIA